MVKRNADGSLKVIGKIPEDGWLHIGPPEVVEAAQAKSDELGRPLTESELDEIRERFNE